jgi:hypothetical protein
MLYYTRTKPNYQNKSKINYINNIKLINVLLYINKKPIRPESEGNLVAMHMVVRDFFICATFMKNHNHWLT